jgi:hypothetical protein
MRFINQNPGATSLACLMLSFCAISATVINRRNLSTDQQILSYMTALGILGMGVCHFNKWLFTDNQRYLLMPDNAAPVVPIFGIYGLNH